MIDKSPARLYYLDSLRGILALTVVVFHFTGGGTGICNNGGSFTVPLFFVLSGLVLAYTYEKKS